MITQHSIATSIKAIGKGLHSGLPVTIELHPAPVDTGVVFRRVDGESRQRSPVCIYTKASNVVNTTLATTLGNGELEVSTVEHLMAALAGLGVDNCFVDVDGPELPIFDGSAAPFVFLLASAGIEPQFAARRFLQINRPIRVESGAASASLRPYKGFRCSYTADYDHPCFKASNASFDFDASNSSFAKSIARARTFAFDSDIQSLQEQNLALGGSLDCAILFDKQGAMNEDGLRYSNEPVRHKLLDAIGDLYMLGYPILGAFTGIGSGHRINNLLLRELLNQRDAWEFVEFSTVNVDAHLSLQIGKNSSYAPLHMNVAKAESDSFAKSVIA